LIVNFANLMEILFLLIPLSVVLVFLIGAGFWWSLRSGQFDDLEGPGHRILMDDDRPPPLDAPVVPGSSDISKLTQKERS
jgi:cbb3-type cytochrome oxidase maturation protein